MVVLLVTFISAAFAATFVFGQTNFLSGYSSGVQNQSECTRLGQTGQEEEYEEMGCGEIYGNIQNFEIEDADNGVTKMDGIAIGAWPSYVVYDSEENYNYEINLEELDGQEYLDEYGGSEWNDGTFEYNSDYYYTVGFQVAYPKSADSTDSTIHWGGDVGNVCHDQETCEVSNNFTYSEPGNMSEDLTPCQDHLNGDQSQFSQRVFIQVFEDRNGDNFQNKQAWVTVMNQSLNLRDTRFNDCWTGNALPSFSNGQMFLREMEVDQNNFMIGQEEEINITVDLSNDRRNVENVSLLMVYPNGSEDNLGAMEEMVLDNVTVGENCGDICPLNATIDLQQQANLPTCSTPQEDDWEITKLFLQVREEFTDEDAATVNSPVDWQIEEMTPTTDYVQDNPILTRCWPEDIPRIM